MDTISAAHSSRDCPPNVGGTVAPVLSLVEAEFKGQTQLPWFFFFCRL
jgi:hypothetical protein